MPVPIPGPEVGHDSQKVKFLTIFGRPKTGIFRRFLGVPGCAPLLGGAAPLRRVMLLIKMIGKFIRVR